MLLFENFNEIHKICQEYGIENYTINNDGSIDVDESVDLSYRKLTKLPLKFRNVSGHFYCNDNNLTTLEGAPISVGGNFSCDNNNLTTLLGAPKLVGGSFVCRLNELTTLEGAPISVGGNFSCDHNNLTTLVGAPKLVGGSFVCRLNELTTLVGAPLSISFNFWCDNNELTTLVGAPKSVSGYFYCGSNPFDVIREIFPNDKEFLNANKEWEFFAGDNKIRRLRFKEALLDYDIELPRYIKGYKYI